MTTRRKRVSKKISPVEDDFKITLVLGAEKYHASAGNVGEAILALRPKKISSRALFVLEHNGKTAQIMRPVARVRYILTHPLAATLLGRWLTLRLT